MTTTDRKRPIGVLFVCTGNICRSPMAEAVFNQMVKDEGLAAHFQIASVGTDDEDAGLPIHYGTRKVLTHHGIPFSDNKRATLITRGDIESYDYILAMTSQHLAQLNALRAVPYGEMRRLMEFAPEGMALDVPDPYYTGNFDQVYTMISAACRGLLDDLREREGL